MSNRMRPHALACFAVLALVNLFAAALEASAATITVTNGLDRPCNAPLALKPTGLLSLMVLTPLAIRMTSWSP